MHGIVEDFYTLLDNFLYEKWGMGKKGLKEVLVECELERRRGAA